MRGFLVLMFAAVFAVFAGPLSAAPAQAPEMAEVAMLLPLAGPHAAQSRAALQGAQEATQELRGPDLPVLQISSWNISGANARNLAESVCEARPSAVIAPRGLPSAVLSTLADCGVPVLLFKPTGSASKQAGDASEAVKQLAGAMARAGSVEPRRYVSTLSEALHGERLQLRLPVRHTTSRSPPKLAPPPTSPPPAPAPVPPKPKQDFPWPPPRPSTETTLPVALLTPPAGATLAALDTRLGAALDAAGYGVRKYHAVPGGYAVVTRLERFSDDGKPAAGTQRWPNDDNEGGFSLIGLIQGLLNATAGHYRVIVFVMRDEAFQTGEKEASKDEANAWLAGGFNQLPDAIAALPWTGKTRCTALVYEFRKPPGGGAETESPPGFLPADTHLRGTGLIKALSTP